jgi:hypothetical protein
MSTITLTPSQHATLAHAVAHTNGKIVWFPDNIKGGARQKVLDGLLNRALITSVDGDWLVTDQGYDALGVARPEPTVAPQNEPEAAPAPFTTPLPTTPDMKADVAAAEASWTKANTHATPTTPRLREGSKQAQVIDMLKSEQGATIQRIMETTQWQSHTVRGFLAGTISKKLGLPLESSKQGKEDRVYRIKNVEAGQSLQATTA